MKTSGVVWVLSRTPNYIAPDGYVWEICRVAALVEE